MNTKKRSLLMISFVSSLLLLILGTGKTVFGSETGNPPQPGIVTGQVLDDQGEALPGVNIMVKGTHTGSITDLDGNYSIEIFSEEDILVFSFVGYLTQEIKAGNQKVINVTFKEDALGLEEVVVVGYGTQKKGILTGSVAAVESDDLVKSPSFTSVSNAIRGQLPGIISVQGSGQPGFDQASLNVRGFGSPLVIVDGIEADFNTLDPSQIASVTLLKDGAASIYGSRAGNGVILITTKRGDSRKPVFSFSTSFTQQGITYMPEMSSSGQIAEMRRETHLQSGQPEETVPYTEEQVQKFYEGTDPQYPNTNWEDLVLNNWAPQQQHNLSVRGGSESIKYYGYLGFNNQESMWKSGNGGSYDRFNFQSNIDAKILDNLTMRFDVAATWEKTKNTNRSQNVGASGGGLWQDYWGTEPMWPGILPDPDKNSYAGRPGVGSVLLSSNTDIIGYNNTVDKTLKGTIALDYRFKSVDGLSANAFFNVRYVNGHNKMFSCPYDFYYYDYASAIYTLAGGYGNNSLTEGVSDNTALTGQAFLKYENVLAENHRLSAMLITEMIDYSTNYIGATRTSFLTSDIDYLFAGSTEGMSNNGLATEMGRMSYIGRLNYSFKDRYLFESIIRADASAKFPEDERWGLFPSFSAGWVISEESFMEGFTALDRLKIRASYGQSGRDAVGNFQYLAGYQLNTRTYILGTGPSTGILSTGMPNPNLTWEEITIYNAGIDFAFFDKALYGEIDAFYRQREGIPATRITSLPSTFGADLPPENLNEISDRGFELMLGTSGASGKFSWDLSANLSWTRAQWEYYEEPVYEDPDQDRIYKNTGRWTDVIYGYRSDGLFTSQEEIDNLLFDQDQKGNTTLNPGDIKYVDLNDDGVLDWKDQEEIGTGTLPHWNTGFNANLRYGDFDCSVVMQGAFGNYHRINLYRMGNPPKEFFEQRWTEENNDADALIPRLGGSGLNNAGSDHWWLKAGYLRLKVVNIGYTLPANWLNRINFNSLRVYLAGTNLFTINPLKDYGVDPEAPSNGDGFYYPQQRTVTVGLDLSF